MEVQSTATAPRPRRALLVLNDLFMEAKIGSVLESVGIPFAVARSNASFLKKLEAITPAVVIVDLIAKGLDALVAVRYLRTTPEIVGVPVIAFATHVDPGSSDEARALGCAEVLTRADLERRLPELALAYAEPIACPEKAAAVHAELRRAWLERARLQDEEG